MGILRPTAKKGDRKFAAWTSSAKKPKKALAIFCKEGAAAQPSLKIKFIDTLRQSTTFKSTVPSF